MLDDWGYPMLLDGADDPALRSHARRAIRACPALALRLRARNPLPPTSVGRTEAGA